jgi:hypothetical protein
LTQTRTQTHILDVTKHNTSRVGRPVLDHVILHAEIFILIKSISPSDSLKDRNACRVGFVLSEARSYSNPSSKIPQAN